MPKITLKEMPMTVVHCKDQEEFRRLHTLRKDAGWNVATLGISRYFENGDGCVDMSNRQDWGHCSTGWYRNMSYTILSLSQFLTAQGIPDIQVGECYRPKDRKKCQCFFWNNGEYVKITDLNYGGNLRYDIFQHGRSERKDWCYSCFSPEDLEPYEPEQQDLKAGDWVEVPEGCVSIGGYMFPAGIFQVIETDEGAKFPVRLSPHYWISRADAAKLRKCPPPEKSPQLVAAEEKEKAVREMLGESHTIQDYKWVVRPNFKFDFNIDEYKSWFYRTPSKQPSISSPLPSMSYTDSAVRAYRNSKLNPSERRLRKAGFRDDCGNWTDKAVRVFMEMQLDESGHKVLDPIAKIELKAKKDEDTDEE